MAVKTKTLTSSADMLNWQYKTLLAELQQIQLHSESADCPCSLRELDPPEFCLAKHTLNVHSLASETAGMDSARADMLYELAEDALDQHNEVKAFLAHKGDMPDLVPWARQWRKKIEVLYYPGSAKLEQSGVSSFPPVSLPEWAGSYITECMAKRHPSLSATSPLPIPAIISRQKTANLNAGEGAKMSQNIASLELSKAAKKQIEEDLAPYLPTTKFALGEKYKIIYDEKGNLIVSFPLSDEDREVKYANLTDSQKDNVKRELDSWVMDGITTESDITPNGIVTLKYEGKRGRFNLSSFWHFDKQNRLVSQPPYLIKLALAEALGTQSEETRKALDVQAEVLGKRLSIDDKITITKSCDKGKCLYDLKGTQKAPAAHHELLNEGQLCKTLSLFRQPATMEDPILAAIAGQICGSGACMLGSGKRTKLPVCTGEQKEKREACIQNVKNTLPEHCVGPKGKILKGEGCVNPFAVCTKSVGCRAGGKRTVYYADSREGE